MFLVIEIKSKYFLKNENQKRKIEMVPCQLTEIHKFKLNY